VLSLFRFAAYFDFLHSHGFLEVGFIIYLKMLKVCIEPDP
jgi:hypothetical protein